MANLPGVLYIGGYQIQGGNPGLGAVMSSIGESNLAYLLDREVMRITPDNPSTGAPTADSLSCWPWYDGNASASLLIITESTTTTATCTLGGVSPAWTTNSLAGRVFTVCNTTPLVGFGFANRMTITSNTANQVTFAATTAPTVGAIAFAGTGRFTDYHPAAGWLVASEYGGGLNSTRGGSSFQALGLGVGPDCTLVRRLLEDIWDEAPYFHLWKYAAASPVVTHWGDSPNNAGRASLESELARVVAAATARSNVIDWEVGIVDFMGEDIVAAIATPALILQYETRLRQMITWLRSASVFNNPDALIVLVNHRRDFYSVTGAGAAPWIRAVHTEIAGDTDGVGVVECDDLPAGDGNDFHNDEVVEYSMPAYMTMGERISECIERLRNGTPASYDGGFPVYLMLGDSIFVGEALSAWTTALLSERISGPNVGSLVRPSNQKVFNRATAALEVYTPHTNSNTSGSSSGAAFAGPDLEIMASLGELHPDGFALIKRASNSSSLATQLASYSSGDGGRWIQAAAQHWDELVADFEAAVTYINDTLHKQVDMRGAFVCLGQNDHAADGGQEFADALLPFCNDLWSTFSTRTGGDKFPIVWRRPQADVANADAAEIALVRDALDELADTEPQFVSVDVDDLERAHDDDIHETPDSALEDGRRLVEALLRVAI